MNLSNDTPATEALNALGWEALETQLAKSKAKQMYKVINGLAPNCVADLFSSKKSTTHYNLRGSSTSLQLPLPKTEYLKKSFCYSGAKLWNLLPVALRESETLPIFNNRINAHTFPDFRKLLSLYELVDK